MMQGARVWLVAAALLGCQGDGQLREPPPDGMPWLAHEYAIELELLTSTCSPGGLSAAALPGVAEVVQRGLRVEWAQRTEAPDGETLYLSGTLCSTDDGPALRLIGGRRDTVSGCQVITDVPPINEVVLADDCDPAGQASLQIDDCGLISGIIEAELRYGSECAHRSACRLTLRLDAVPTVLDGRAPERPAACL